MRVNVSQAGITSLSDTLSESWPFCVNVQLKLLPAGRLPSDVYICSSMVCCSIVCPAVPIQWVVATFAVSRVNGLFFFFGFLFQFLIVPAIVGSALLHRLSDDRWEKITAWIYGMGLCALFIVSTVFHIVSWKKSHLRYGCCSCIDVWLSCSMRFQHCVSQVAKS